MLAILVKFVHLVVCIALIVIVLFQADKGEGLAGAFGGGASATLFGERGAETQISKMTTYLAIVFMITSLIIAVFGPGWEESNEMAMNNQPITAIPSQNPVPVQVPNTNPVNPMPFSSLPTTAPENAPVAPVPVPTPVTENAPVVPVTVPTPVTENAPVAPVTVPTPATENAPVAPVTVPTPAPVSENVPQTSINTIPTDIVPGEPIKSEDKSQQLPPQTGVPGVNGL